MSLPRSFLSVRCFDSIDFVKQLGLKGKFGVRGWLWTDFEVDTYKDRNNELTLFCIKEVCRHSIGTPKRHIDTFPW